MATIFHLEEKKVDKTMYAKICWRSNWISPFESPWGVFEKFKHANEADMKDILQLFGNERVRALKNPSSNLIRDLINLNAFDPSKLLEGLQYDLISTNERNVMNIVGVMPDWHFDGLKKFESPIFFRRELAYCEQCFKKGYHSLFHQFVLLSDCPYHLTPLKYECPSCSSKIPYLLLRNEFRAPFICRCGYNFLSYNDYSLIDWKPTSIEELHSEVVKKWINLNDSQVERLASLFIDPNFDWASMPNSLEKVYDLIKKEDERKSLTDEFDKHNHYVVSSSSYIKNIRGIKEKREDQIYTKKYYPKINSDYIWKMKYLEFIKELNQSFEITISGLAKHIRKELSDHKTCIKHFFRSLEEKNNEPLCPYAYAYLNWRHSLQNYFFLGGVDNCRTPDRSEGPYLRFPPYFSYQLSELYRYFRRETEDITLESRASLKWGLNRIIIHFAYHYFLNWLEKSADFANRRVEVGTIPFDQNDVPFYIAKLPWSDNESYEFHWWKEKKEKKELHLLCPYNSVKKRRIKQKAYKRNRID
ncbi:hypothetical protein [Paenibacillus sp. JJ1722]|uniref:hypothetical protein n=1 Tax=Paenibacillus sp. JJ1722 TaxID=3398770 RepID=UPI003AAA4FB7